MQRSHVSPSTRWLQLRVHLCSIGMLHSTLSAMIGLLAADPRLADQIDLKFSRDTRTRTPQPTHPPLPFTSGSIYLPQSSHRRARRGTGTIYNGRSGELVHHAADIASATCCQSTHSNGFFSSSTSCLPAPTGSPRRSTSSQADAP